MSDGSLVFVAAWDKEGTTSREQIIVCTTANTCFAHGPAMTRAQHPTVLPDLLSVYAE